MTQQYDETNRGKIWKNEKKNPEHPEYRETLADFTGELDIDGRKFFVDAWKRKPDANPKAPALNFKVKPKNVQPGVTQAQATIRKPDPITSGVSGGAGGYVRHSDMNDDIPFAPEFR